MKNVRLGIVGFGKVIRSFLETLPEKHEYIQQRYQLDIKIVSICDSTEYMINADGFIPEELLSHKLSKDSSSDRSSQTLCSDIPMITDSFMQNGVDAVVESLPPDPETGEPALTYLLTFLSRKIPIVTVNKSPLVHGFHQLYQVSQKMKTPFKFSGATASALPTTDIASVSLAGAGIYGFEGILNGTTNFLLTEVIHNKSSLEEEIEMAVELKICEPDPSLDIDGWDTAFKTLILARAFINPFLEIDQIDVNGIRGLTYKEIAPVINQGNTIKLLGKASYREDQFRMRVTPSIITQSHPFYGVDGASKAATFYTDSMGTLTLIGGTSGLKETAAVILKDIINLFRDPFMF